jgi:hypothetical protein
VAKIVLIRVLNPNTTSNTPPSIDIHFLKWGAFARSQPVIPATSNIGDKAVPIPNSMAMMKLSSGVVNAAEYVTRRSSNGGHTIRPLLRPSEKAWKSNLSFILRNVKFVLSFGMQLLQVCNVCLFLNSMFTPIAMVTMAKAKEEYVWNEESIWLLIIILNKPIAAPMRA